MNDPFVREMTDGYAFDEPSLLLGAPMLDGEVVPSAKVRLPLSMVNRHGLVAGATGTGKTKTLQILAGQLSDAGVPVFVSDVKGDLTSLMDAVDEETRAQLIAAGTLQARYTEPVDRESAHEIITARLNGAADAVAGDEPCARSSARCSARSSLEEGIIDLTEVRVPPGPGAPPRPTAGTPGGHRRSRSRTARA